MAAAAASVAATAVTTLEAAAVVRCRRGEYNPLTAAMAEEAAGAPVASANCCFPAAPASNRSTSRGS